MLFNSYIFVFVFFPICLVGYYGLLKNGKSEAAKVFLTVVSLWFYGYFNLSYLLIMVCSIAGNYLFHRLLSREPRKAVMILAVALNLGVLFYFKYFDFFLDTVNVAFGTDFVLRGILLPLGISFFTFQQISFIVDTYRGEVADCSLSEYALFVSFFPQLIAGPIVNHNEMLPQFRAFGKKKADWEQIAGGFALFVLGLAKKVLLADTFGAGVDYGYENLALLGRGDAALVIFFYALQLYFDFSGYCDMARGISRMFGIELSVNFNSPYQAWNIVEFWKRWHITLNRFFTRYLYIPLGGNRKGKARTYRNLLLVFLFSGIWHGAGWNFIFWGMMHGLLYVLTRMVQDWKKMAAEKTGSGLARGIGRLFTFCYVTAAWVYFRAESVAQGNSLLAKIFTGGFVRVNRNLAGYFNLDEFWYILKVLRLDRWEFGHYILMCVLTVFALALVFFGKNAAEAAEKTKPKAWTAVIFSCLLLWCVLTFSNVSTFLYFNF